MEQLKHLETAKTIIKIIAGLSKRRADQIGLQDTLTTDLQLDSLHILELLTLLEDTFHFEAETDDLQPHFFHSVETVIQFVKRRADAT